MAYSDPNLWFVSRYRVDSQGYHCGQYWGVGQPLWYARNATGRSEMDIFRAKDREAAKAIVKAHDAYAHFIR